MADYTDPDLSTDERVEDLLDRMTLDEKIGQLLSSPQTGEADEIRERVGERIRERHLGQVSPIGRVGAPDDPREAVELVNDLQRIAVEETRLGVPLLIVANAVHGHAFVKECGAFPHALGMAAARDEALVERVGEVTARELAATGVRVNYGPVLDVGRDPRWGRTFETFGESTYLCGELGAASVRGHQAAETDVRTTVKHFPAYGEPYGGEDAGVNELSASTFRRMHYPAHERALEAGADDVMPCYNSIDGDPVHGSRRWIDRLLREERDFDGFVVSDHHGTQMLTEEHRTARSMREAVRQSLDAGIDAFLDSDVTDDYPEHVRSLVEDGDLPEERVDEAVRRVLRAKVELGLFEDPYTDPERVEREVGTGETRDLEREAARKSLVLLQNEGVLPLSGDEDLLVTGPAADEIDHLLGGWSRVGGDGTTVLEGIEAAADGEVVHESGAGLREREDVDAAREAAAAADVAVVALGDGAYIHEFGLSPHAGETGEYPTRTRLELPEAQRDLLRAVHETGTPTVGLYVGGRPPVMPWAAEHVPALLVGFYPGAYGGDAVADVLFGADPGGALPISVPKSTGHLPERFNHLRQPGPIGPDQHPDTYDPLYPFGHGESYAEFEVRDLEVTPTTADPDGTVTVATTVENVAERAGTKPLDVFVSDCYSSRVTPVRELRGFESVELDGGERRRVEVPVDVSTMGVYQGDGTRRVEPGAFEVQVEGEAARFEVE